MSPSTPNGERERESRKRERETGEGNREARGSRAHLVFFFLLSARPSSKCRDANRRPLGDILCRRETVCQMNRGVWRIVLRASSLGTGARNLATPYISTIRKSKNFHSAINCVAAAQLADGDARYLGPNQDVACLLSSLRQFSF